MPVESVLTGAGAHENFKEARHEYNESIGGEFSQTCYNRGPTMLTNQVWCLRH